MSRRVFVSYARRDARVVGELVADVRALGHEVWMDLLLEGGTDWWAEILGHLRGCDVFVQALSPASLDSAACRRESRYARALERPLLLSASTLRSTSAGSTQTSPAGTTSIPAGDKAATLRLVHAVNGLPAAPPLPRHCPRGRPPPPRPPAGARTVRRPAPRSPDLLPRQLASRARAARGAHRAATSLPDRRGLERCPVQTTVIPEAKEEYTIRRFLVP